ncbi:hypothetical protein MNBD_ALPHA02-1267 [hydrothermal vent metagenome]|uniref:Uncharacterized protein n=1 Tax=hydrothermal vent metagenome TaxID=652676 RepID=A0A3B0SDX9_9ZZZZ
MPVINLKPDNLNEKNRKFAQSELFPAVVFLLGAIVFTRFGLNRSEHKIIQDELLRRKRMKEA